MDTPNSTNDPTQDSTAEPSRLQREELPTSPTRCERCRIEQATPESRWPTCLHCLESGLECVMPFEGQKTSRPDAKVIAKQGSESSRHEIIIKREDEDELLGTEMTIKTEGGPEPRILQAQGTLDSSLTAANSIGNKVTGNNLMAAQGYFTQRQILASRRPNCRSLQINSVKVLDWPVFAGQFEPQAKGMAAVPQAHSERRQPPLSALDSFLRDPEVADRLVINFVHSIHTMNPVLDVASLRKRALDVYSRGIE